MNTPRNRETHSDLGKKIRRRENASLHSGGLCPACGKAYLERVKRKGWISSIPDSKQYQCPKCSTKFLRVFGLLTFQIRKRSKPVIGAHANLEKYKAIIVASLLVIIIYLSYSLVFYFYERESATTEATTGNP